MTSVKTNPVQNLESSISTSSSTSSTTTAGRKHSTNSTPPSSAGSSCNIYINKNEQQPQKPSESAIDDTDDTNISNIPNMNSQPLITSTPPSDLTISNIPPSALSKKIESNPYHHHHRLPSYASSITKSSSQHDSSNFDLENKPLSSNNSTSTASSSSSALPKSSLMFAKKAIPKRSVSLTKHNGTPLSRLSVNNNSTNSGSNMPNITCPIHGLLNVSTTRHVSLPPSDVTMPSSNNNHTNPAHTSSSSPSTCTTTSSQNSRESASSNTSASSTLSNAAQPDPSCEECMSIVQNVQARAKAAILALSKTSPNTDTNAHSNNITNNNINTNNNNSTTLLSPSSSSSASLTSCSPIKEGHGQKTDQTKEIKGRATLPRLNKTTSNTAHRDLFAPKDSDVPMSVEIGAHSAFVSRNRLAKHSTSTASTSSDLGCSCRSTTTLTPALGVASSPGNPGSKRGKEGADENQELKDSKDLTDSNGSNDLLSSKDLENCENPTDSSQCKRHGPSTSISTPTSASNSNTNSNSLQFQTKNTDVNSNFKPRSAVPSAPASERVLPSLCVKVPPKLALNLPKRNNTSVANLTSLNNARNPRVSAMTGNASRAISLPSSPTNNTPNTNTMPISHISSAASARAVKDEKSSTPLINTPTDLRRNGSSSSLSTIQAVPAFSQRIPQPDTRVVGSNVFESNKKEGNVVMNVGVNVGIRPTKKPIYTPSVLRRTMTADRLNTIGTALANKSKASNYTPTATNNQKDDEDAIEYYNYCNALAQLPPLHKPPITPGSYRSPISSKQSPIHSPQSTIPSTGSLSATSLSSLTSSQYASQSNNDFSSHSNLNNSNKKLTRSTSSFLDQPSKAHWRADNSRNSCKSCLTSFSLFNRRHHCRHCGDLFCDKCSSLQVRLDPGCSFHLLGQKARACVQCFELYREFVNKADDATDINSLAEYSGTANNWNLYGNIVDTSLNGFTRHMNTGASIPDMQSRANGVNRNYNNYIDYNSNTNAARHGPGASFCISPVNSASSSRNGSVSMSSSSSGSGAASPRSNMTLNYQSLAAIQHQLTQNGQSSQNNSRQNYQHTNTQSQNTHHQHSNSVQAETNGKNGNNLDNNSQPFPAGSVPANWNWSTF